MRRVDGSYLARTSAKWTPVRRQGHAPLKESRAWSDSYGMGHAPEGKYLGLATVAIASLATFGLMGTNGLIALALSVAFMGAYWFIYGDQ